MWLPRLTAYNETKIAHELVRRPAIVMTTISSKFQIVISKEVWEKLRFSRKQRLHVMAKGGIITLVPEVPLMSLDEGSKGCPKPTCRRRRTDHKGTVEVPFSWKGTLL
jgi:bifunctional DNA-binding transcriptional regulator/antitoxin component of YhaV-PrlF toxin-antitoxin module